WPSRCACCWTRGQTRRCAASGAGWRLPAYRPCSPTPTAATCLTSRSPRSGTATSGRSGARWLRCRPVGRWRSCSRRWAASAAAGAGWHRPSPRSWCPASSRWPGHSTRREPSCTTTTDPAAGCPTSRSPPGCTCGSSPPSPPTSTTCCRWRQRWIARRSSTPAPASSIRCRRRC
ncbi:MAG: hypothetical protein AVDCRST_MAG34-2545, partial [uncultured Nocardioidaceae bacterium]